MRASWLVLSLIILLPAASAASVTGDLRFQEEIVLRGPVEVQLGSAVDLAPALQREEALEIRWQRANGYRVTRVYDYHGPGPGLVEAYAGDQVPENETLSWGPGGLLGLGCAPDKCRALLLAEDGGELALVGNAAGAIRRAGETRAFASGAAGPGQADTFYHETPASAWAFSGIGGGASPVEGAQLRASGNLLLFLANASATLDLGGSLEPFSTEQEEERRDVAGLPTGRRHVVPFVVLHLEGASITSTAGSRAVLYGASPLLSLGGVVDAERATGTLVIDGEQRDVRDESVHLRGLLDIRMEANEALVSRVALPSGIQPPSRMTLAGEAEEVRVGGAIVAAKSARGSVAAEGGIVLLLVLLWGLLKAPAVAGLYSRIASGAALRNKNRAAIHAEITAANGLGVADIIRKTDLAETVVRHHLRLLESHNLIVARAEGRIRLYYPSSNAPPAEVQGAVVALRDDTRRVVAVAVARAEAGLTQREIVARTGASQRLVSYHLSRLHETGLIEKRDGFPLRYCSTRRLAEMLHDGRSESEPLRTEA